MRKKLLTLLCGVALLCTACTVPAAQTQEPAEGEYEVYFLRAPLNTEDGLHIPAESGYLAREFHTLPEEEPAVEALIGLLLAGPEGAGLASPFPADTRLRSWHMEEGRAILDLSEAYGGLTGVELTLADGCIVLTLCQLPEVEEVYITVEGRRRPFRDQVYTGSDFIGDNRFDMLPPVEAEEMPAETGEGEDLPAPEPSEG